MSTDCFIIAKTRNSKDKAVDVQCEQLNLLGETKEERGGKQLVTGEKVIPQEK